MTTQTNVEEPLRAGLRNLWYPLAQAAQLGAQPLGMRALGEELVLWRDSAGRAHTFVDRCPHRDTRLSLGAVVGGVLACAYHGLQFDATGQCVAVPTEGGDCPLARRLRVRSYPTEERAGLIFGYIGDVERLPPPPLTLAAELEDPAWSGFICEATWQASWLRILDNLTDPMHGPYLHGHSYTLSRGLKADRIAVTELQDGGFLIARKNQRDVNIDWIEFHNTGLLWNRLDIPYPPSAGPGGPLRIISLVRPHDEHWTTAYFLRYRQVSGWRRRIWRTLYRGVLERKHWAVLEQDRVALERLRGVESRLHEHLAQADLGVIHQRRLLQQELARQQAESAQPEGANGSSGDASAGLVSGAPTDPAALAR